MDHHHHHHHHRSIGIAHSTLLGFNRNDQHNVAATDPSLPPIPPAALAAVVVLVVSPRTSQPSHTKDTSLHFSEEEKVGSPEEITLFCALDADADEDGRC